jgi:MoxR-like ATPase
VGFACVSWKDEREIGSVVEFFDSFGGVTVSVLREAVEVSYASELLALDAVPGAKPPGWRRTPQAVLTYLLGGVAPDGTVITPKFIGARGLIETAVATLATDRALLLLGVPGTAKSWVSEHLAAAISNDSMTMIQCTSGTDEQQVRYGWNYALLLANGPSRAALVPTPLMRAMEQGSLCRLEELTRMGSDVQDTLITILSEKTLLIPELDTALQAQRGFNIIATANNKDKGVNELSSALKRRFNTVILPLPANAEVEVRIVMEGVKRSAAALALPIPAKVEDEVVKLVRMFRELRDGRTSDGSRALKMPSGGLSSAEAIAVMIGGLSHATYFRDGELGIDSLAGPIVGAVIKDPISDAIALKEYVETILRKRVEYGTWAETLMSVA